VRRTGAWGALSVRQNLPIRKRGKEGKQSSIRATEGKKRLEGDYDYFHEDSKGQDSFHYSILKRRGGVCSSSKWKGRGYTYNGILFLS